MIKNWKTTAAGVATIIVGLSIAIYAAATTNDAGQIKAGIGLVAAGLIGVFAKDGSAAPPAAG